MDKKIKKNNKLMMPILIGRFKLTIENGIGISEKGYFHLPLLTFGLGKNGFGIHILGLYIGLSWE